jgi:hypothetical protein
MLPNFDVLSLKKKRVCIIHWTQCTNSAIALHELISPFTNRIHSISVQNHDKHIHDQIFSNLDNYDTVIMLGHDAVTNECMAIHIKGRETSYLVNIPPHKKKNTLYSSYTKK